MFGSANSTLVNLFYTNIMEQDLEDMFLKSSINSTIVYINSNVIT